MFDLGNNTQRAVRAVGANPLSDPRPTALTRGKTQLGTLKLNKSYSYIDKVRAGNADVFVFKVKKQQAFFERPTLTFEGQGRLEYTLRNSKGKRFASGFREIIGGGFTADDDSSDLKAGTYKLTIKTPSVEAISYTLDFKLTSSPPSPSFPSSLFE